MALPKELQRQGVCLDFPTVTVKTSRSRPKLSVDLGTSKVQRLSKFQSPESSESSNIFQISIISQMPKPSTHANPKHGGELLDILKVEYENLMSEGLF